MDDLDQSAQSPRPIGSGKVGSLVAAAFLCPGTVLGIGGFIQILVAPASYEPPVPTGPLEWVMAISGLSLAGALFGSPIIFSALLMLVALHRLGWTSLSVLTAVGLVCGAIPVALLSNEVLDLWFVGQFLVAGAATGAIIWAIAYRGRTHWGANVR